MEAHQEPRTLKPDSLRLPTVEDLAALGLNEALLPRHDPEDAPALIVEYTHHGEKETTLWASPDAEYQFHCPCGQLVRFNPPSAEKLLPFVKDKEGFLKARKERRNNTARGNPEYLSKIAEMRDSMDPDVFRRMAGVTSKTGRNGVKLCAKCGKVGPGFCCGACRLIFYCSRECQAADWKQHKPECAGRRQNPTV